MGFEFDKQKSVGNKAKHGIDFLEAQALWEECDRIEIPARTEDEQRFLAVGRIKGRHWSAVITYRGESIRLISVRPANRKEAEIYEG